MKTFKSDTQNYHSNFFVDSKGGKIKVMLEKLKILCFKLNEKNVSLPKWALPHNPHIWEETVRPLFG